MIPYDVTYLRAHTIDEAVSHRSEAADAGREALYYGGGTEIVTLSRDNKQRADLFIDYKAIPEANVFGRRDGRFEVGSAVRLNRVVDTPGAGLLAACSGGVADRTVRNSITVGGNICGMLAYREAVLPFLLLDGEVTFARPTGAGAPLADDPSDRTRDPIGDSRSADGVVVERHALQELFDKRLHLPDGGLALSFSMPQELLDGLGMLTGDTAQEDADITAAGGHAVETAVDGALRRSVSGTPSSGGHSGASSRSLFGPVTVSGEGPRGRWFYQRRTKEARLDYPVATVAMAMLDGTVRMAVAGAWGYPVRCTKAETVLNEHGFPRRHGGRSAADDAAGDYRTTAERAVDAVDLTFKKDMRAGRAYRREMTILAVEDGLRHLAEHAGRSTNGETR